MAGNLRAFLAEFIGTFALVFIAAGAICMDSVTGGRVGIVGIAFAYGLTAMAMIYTYGPISGGHFNPAITAALMMNHRINKIKGIFYIGAQLLGAAAAALSLKASFHPYPNLLTSAPFLGACDLSAIGYKAGTFLEALMTFLVVSAFYRTTVDSQNSQGTVPMAVGVTITAAVLAIGPLTGAALNPARQFGPAIVTGHWSHCFVYWIGPLAGAALASWIYENLYLDKKS